MSPYPGSKGQAGVFQTIIGQMPPHSLYVEPFFGSGRIFWQKARAELSVLIDLAPGAIAKAGAEAGVIASAGDAIEKLSALQPALPPDAVIYCDPPYPLSVRGRPGRIYYDQNLFPESAEMTDQQHELLLKLLNGLQCHVLLSGYDCPLYSSHLQSWRCLKYKTMTRGGVRTECLWCNFPEPVDLHDWRYAGKNFRQRCGLKRLASRWVTKLERMNERQRGYVLNAVHQRYSQRAAPALNGEAGAVYRALKSEPTLRSGEIKVKMFQDRKSGEHWAKCYLGNLRVFETERRDQGFQAMVEAQDWALRHGKSLRFENES